MDKARFKNAGELAITICRLRMQDEMSNTDIWELDQLEKLWAETYGHKTWTDGRKEDE